MKRFMIAFLLVVVSLSVFFSTSTYAASNSFTQTQVGADGIKVAGSDKIDDLATDANAVPLIETIRTAINTVLGFLGLIALVLLLWGGFQMVTAAGDDKKYNSGFAILKHAGAGLIFIGVAALLVNAIMWFISSIGA